MMCFRDMTFCSSDCTNNACHRFFGPEHREEAEDWMENPPVAFSDFSSGCPDYIASFVWEDPVARLQEGIAGLDEEFGNV